MCTAISPRAQYGVASPRIEATGRGFQPPPADERLRTQLAEMFKSFAKAAADAESFKELTAGCGNAQISEMIGKCVDSVRAAGDALLTTSSLVVNSLPETEAPVRSALSACID